MNHYYIWLIGTSYFSPEESGT